VAVVSNPLHGPCQANADLDVKYDQPTPNMTDKPISRGPTGTGCAPAPQSPPGESARELYPPNSATALPALCARGREASLVAVA